jgi:hypothetical protein
MRLCHHRASQVEPLGAASSGSFEAASSITIDQRVASGIVELLRMERHAAENYLSFGVMANTCVGASCSPSHFVTDRLRTV